MAEQTTHLSVNILEKTLCGIKRTVSSPDRNRTVFKFSPESEETDFKTLRSFLHTGAWIIGETLESIQEMDYESRYTLQWKLFIEVDENSYWCADCLTRKSPIWHGRQFEMFNELSRRFSTQAVSIKSIKYLAITVIHVVETLEEQFYKYFP